MGLTWGKGHLTNCKNLQREWSMGLKEISLGVEECWFKMLMSILCGYAGHPEPPSSP